MDQTTGAGQKYSRFRWLDLQRYFEIVRPHDDIVGVNYFTARVNGPSGIDQATYLNALETLPKVTIIEGKFKSKDVICRVPTCALKRQVFQQPEEKRTDVNIALQMLDDAYQGLADRMILVSGDSDLVPAVNLVKHRASNCEIIVYIPNNHPKRGAAVELRAAAHKVRNLPLVELARAQFPAIVNGPGGASYARLCIGSSSKGRRQEGGWLPVAPHSPPGRISKRIFEDS